jgi:hypothetical protein
MADATPKGGTSTAMRVMIRLGMLVLARTVATGGPEAVG